MTSPVSSPASVPVRMQQHVHPASCTLTTMLMDWFCTWQVAPLNLQGGSDLQQISSSFALKRVSGDSFLSCSFVNRRGHGRYSGQLWLLILNILLLESSVFVLERRRHSRTEGFKCDFLIRWIELDILFFLFFFCWAGCTYYTVRQWPYVFPVFSWLRFGSGLLQLLYIPGGESLHWVNAFNPC